VRARPGSRATSSAPVGCSDTGGGVDTQIDHADGRGIAWPLIPRCRYRVSAPGPGRPQRPAGSGRQSRRDLTEAFAGSAEYRRGLDARRASIAGAAAEAIVAELVESAPNRTDAELEDELCARLGTRLCLFIEKVSPTVSQYRVRVRIDLFIAAATPSRSSTPPATR
jgi:hypothetical protein